MDTQKLEELLINYFEPIGLESHLFKAVWYNELVTDTFKLDIDDNTICAVILSLPLFFEKAFIPFVNKNMLSDNQDPIDSCISYHVKNLKNNLSFEGLNMSFIFDYELLPNRRPKILVQTAAHVAGAAFYYQQHHLARSKNLFNETNISSRPESKSDILYEPKEPQEQVKYQAYLFDKNRKVFGVCIHPKYGGWFAIRSVIIFHGVIDKNLKFNPPLDCVPTTDLRNKLLYLFNHNWKDWTYRDIIPVCDKYSDIQKQYFSTMPKQRNEILKHISKLTN